MPHIIKTELRESDAGHKKHIVGSCKQKLPAVRKDGAVTSDFSLWGRAAFHRPRRCAPASARYFRQALARTWITNFTKPLIAHPVGTLESHGIFIPSNMSIEFQRKTSDRPRIVVYEQNPNSKFKARVLYLQLVMMAGR